MSTAGNLLRPLGALQIPALGMGCWAIGGPFTRSGGRPMGWGDVDDRESIRAIHCALDHGIRLFDTANNYGAGRSERVLGRALAGRRDQAIIATKFGSVFDEAARQHLDIEVRVDESFIRSALEESLNRLGVDHIDLYQFHVGAYECDAALEVQEVLEQLVSEGKINGYGWSTDHPDRAAVFASGKGCIAIQHALDLLTDASELLELCDKHDLASVTKSPLRGGLLTGKFTEDTTFPPNDLRSGMDFTSPSGKRALGLIEGLRELLAVDGRTVAQGAIAWIWARHPRTIPIPGFKNEKQASENAAALQFGPLSDAQMRAIQDQVRSIVTK